MSGSGGEWLGKGEVVLQVLAGKTVEWVNSGGGFVGGSGSGGEWLGKGEVVLQVLAGKTVEWVKSKSFKIVGEMTEGEMKAITTCSGVAYKGPSIPTPKKAVERETEEATRGLPELTPTCKTLELADRSVSKPIGIAKDVKVKVANKIDVTDEACKEYFQEVLSFSNVTASGSPTPSDDPIVSTTSPTLTPFGDSDFLLFEEANAFLGLEDDPDTLELDPSYYDLEGDIQMLKAILNSDPAPPSQTMNNLCLRSQTNSRLVKLKRSNLPLMNLLRSNSRTYLPILNMNF
nr:reverse transcriptase domain-containing protein [Tanacetum cinerariifolium]